ncbi:MAG: DNA polymerase IV [Planctomycetes bacterium]|nr:DNA polymerase IV [Planctomycetota bacterium]
MPDADASAPPPRCILHLDMDAFYASVEQRDFPALRGKPILVGFDSPRSVVTTASYEARPFGCRSALPMSVAKRMCPHAIVVPPRFEAYAEASSKVFAILESLSPLVEPLSLDEAFVDVTGTERLLGPPVALAATIRARVRSELQLTASVGVAPNKFLAKLASDLRKPDGLTVIGAGDVERMLAPLPVGRIWGIGPKTAERLAAEGIRTIADLRRVGADELERRHGDSGRHWWELAWGIDDRPVVPDTQAKSLGQERTFETDLPDADVVRSILLAETEDVARRVRRSGFLAREVSVKIRFGDFETITRQATLPAATDVTAELWAGALSLFDRWARGSFRPVRLIGVTASRLSVGGRQAALFDEAGHERKRRADLVSDAIVAKFGAGAVRRAGGQTAPQLSPPTDGD